MGIPARPHFQPQGPDSRCIIDGKQLGWENCTPDSVAMAMEKATLGRVYLTACAVRKRTGDTSGGTTLEQCARVARSLGVAVSVYDAGNLATPVQVARWLRAGRGVVVQGNTSALLSHPSIRSTGGPVNHATYFNEVRGGTTDHPNEVLAFDPAADGRTAGWGKADQGPSWWPWEMALAFMAALRPSSTDGGVTGTRLGAGKAYCAVFADTEPHVHLDPNARRTSPFPDRVRFDEDNVPVFASADSDSTVRYRRNRGALFIAYQQYDNWLGDHNGTHWVRKRQMRRIGGST